VPWGNSSLVGRGFIFNKGEAEADTKVAAAPKSESGAQTSRELEAAVLNTMRDQTEAIYWQSIQGADDPQYFETYLKRFPNGVFSELARLKIDSLKRASAAREPAAANDAAKTVAPAVEGEKIEQAAPATEAVKQEVPKEVASLDAGAKPQVEAQTEALAAQDEPLARESVAAIQSELVRLGCLQGRADGIWGNRSRGAVEAFARQNGAKLASLEPSLDLLNELKAVGERVCPLVCGRGEALVDGACIAEKPASKTASIERKQKAKSAPKQEGAVQSSAAKKQTSQKKKTIHDTLKNLNESNRHMQFGQDSDGAQM
jgi:peptidoglycan hydrolase-like protein with peptidoglycan-binding domain